MEQAYIARDRRELLQSVAAGRVYRSLGGCDMQMARAGQNRRVETRLREIADWVELGPDGRHYRLTAAGRVALDRSLAAYAELVGGGRR